MTKLRCVGKKNKRNDVKNWVVRKTKHLLIENTKDKDILPRANLSEGYILLTHSQAVSIHQMENRLQRNYFKQANILHKETPTGRLQLL